MKDFVVINDFLDAEQVDNLIEQFNELEFTNGAAVGDDIFDLRREVTELVARKDNAVIDTVMPKVVSHANLIKLDEAIGAFMCDGSPAVHDIRTDLAYVLFLTDPSDYEGGELVVSTDLGENIVKLRRGSLFVYSNNYLSHFNAITSGFSYLATGWIQSKFRDSDQRDVMTDLQLIFSNLMQKDNKDPNLVGLKKTINNLHRMWAE